MNFGRKWLASLLLAGLSALSAQAHAAPQSQWVENDAGGVRLISSAAALGEADRVQLGLEFRLKPGWKIYWRSPGDAGYPPSVDWKGSDNLDGTVMSWPAPQRFIVSGMQTVGYEGEVVLPIVARPTDPARPLSLRASVDYLACGTLCVPEHAALALDLGTGPATPSPHAHAIGRSLARVPGLGAKEGLALKRVEETDQGLLKVTVEATPPLVKPDLFVECADQTQFEVPKVTLESGGTRAVFLLKPVKETGDGDLTNQPVTLTVIDGERAMEVVSDIAPPRSDTDIGRLLAMLGVALLGGLILNVMPCVLPVLSVKVLAVIGHSGAGRERIRADFLASAGGIVTSFLILAAAALIVKEAGVWVGWGIQFQQPLFLAAMTALVVLFAANLWGFFEIPLPALAADAAEAALSRTTDRRAGHFAEGMFAALLATPCSAPFVGTALGFALARGPLEILLIFLALGVGMAAPYLCIAAWPGLAGLLPRPGRWMVLARRILGLALLGTGVWLLFVLSSESGRTPALAVGGLMTAAFAVLAVSRRLPAFLRLVSAGIPVAVALWTASAIADAPETSDPPATLEGIWHPFEPETIARLVEEKKVVLVDVTADWCLTCKVNKATVLYREPVASALEAPDVVAMRADWTRPDDDVSSFLAGFDRYGVPFDVLYGPGAPGGIPLPELLSTGAVMDALKTARKTGP